MSPPQLGDSERARLHQCLAKLQAENDELRKAQSAQGIDKTARAMISGLIERLVEIDGKLVDHDKEFAELWDELQPKMIVHHLPGKGG